MLRHPAITLTTLLLTIALNIYLFVIVPKGFFPQQDNGTISGGIQGSQDASFPAMQSAAVRFVRAITNDPAVQNVVAFTGGGGAANSGFIFMALKPLEERKVSADQIIARLRPKLGAVPGASLFLQAGQDLRIGGRQSSAQYQYTIQSENSGRPREMGANPAGANEKTARLHRGEHRPAKQRPASVAGL